MKNHVLMFAEAFAQPVFFGLKKNTIRREKSPAVEVGDALSLRKWEGKAYRSKQVVLFNAVCAKVRPIELFTDGARVNGKLQNRLGLEMLAKADGFENWDAMKAWFVGNYSLPFKGVLIGW